MRCTAHRKNGDQCKARAIRGTNVCKVHGGSAPQVREKARQRLLEMVDPALAQLRRLIVSKHPPTSLGAVKDALDRAGFKPKDQVELNAAIKFVIQGVDGADWLENLKEKDSSP